MSRIQINLLPDIKVASLKSQRQRTLIVTIAVVVTIVSAAMFLIMLFTVGVVQNKQISNAKETISKHKKELDSIADLNRMITIQSQLDSLVTLHQQKHISSRLFTYLPEVTPTNVHIGQISIDFTANTMQVAGTAASQQATNTFIDTLKFTTFKVGETDESKPAFPSVVESSFSTDAAVGATYSLSITFDPALFSNDLEAKTPALVVPQLTTTHSLLNDPSNSLFDGQNQLKNRNRSQ